jgi:GAF domain-containing protein
MTAYLQDTTLEHQIDERTRELSEARQQQAATAEVLKVISRSAFDLQSVLDTLTESAAQLCRADMAGITRPVGEDHYYATNHNFSPDWLAYVKDIPLRRDRGSIVGRVILDRDVVQVADVLTDPEYTYSDPARKAGYRTFLGVPLLREGEVTGVLVLARKSIAPFTDKQVELLVTFADQAVIAIENARLFEEVQARNHDLREALEQQTATSEILREISRSPTDLQPVFDMIAQSAARLCESQFCFVADYDGTLIHFMAQHGLPAETVKALHRAYPLPPSKGSVAARTVLSGRVEQIPDIDADADYELHQIDKRAYRSMLGVPILKDGRPVGAVVVGRSQTGNFSERQIKLLETFADQAVIAIGNVRLFTEVQARNRDLNEALEQQTATADVLKVISRSAFDLQNVLDTLVQSAARLCEADMVSVTRQKADSNFHYHVASHGFSPEWFDFMQTFPLEPDRGTLIGRTLVEGRAVHIPDVLADEEYTANQAQSLGGFRTMLGVPLLREGSIIGVFLIARRAVKPFSEKQIELVTTFADQAVIAIENVRLFDELTARNSDLNEALEQQTATSEILRAISMSPSSVQPVFETIVRNAVSLCGSLFANVFRFDGELLHFVASHNVGLDYVELLQEKYPMRPDSSQVSGRVLLSKSVVRLEDALADPDYDYRFPLAMGWRKMLGVPMLREGDPLGVIVVGWAEAGPVSKRQEDLLRTFADQAVIAIENVRLFDEVRARTRELSEALEQQTATSEVLRIISSSPGELEPVFQAMLANATRICEANTGTMYYCEDDAFHMAAWLGASPALAEFYSQRGSFQPPAGTPLDRLLQTREVIHIADDAAEPNPGAATRLGGARTVLAVPMLSDNELVGAIVIYRQEVRPFSDKQIDLIASYADQAVIAIENVRLFGELHESLRQQTATADVLKAISQSAFDLDRIFEVVGENALRLCGADKAFIFRFDGEVMRSVFAKNASPELLDFIARNPIRPGRHTATARAALLRQTVYIEDVSIDPEFTYGARDVDPLRTTLSVPILKGDELLGVITIYRLEVKPFTEHQIALVETFADQAAIAIEHVRLLTDLREALQQQTAMADVLRAISRSTFDLPSVLSTLVEAAVRLCEADQGTIAREQDGVFVRVASHGFSPEFLAAVLDKPVTLDRGSASGRALVERRVIHIPDVALDPDYDFAEALQHGGFRTLIGVPMLRDGAAIGVLAMTRKETRPFTEKEIELVSSFADQAAIAIENARLFDEVQTRTRELAQSVEELRALGEVSQAVNSTLDLETVLDTIVAKAVQLSGTDAGSIYVLNKAGTKFRLRATYGMDEATVAAIRDRRIRSGETAIGEATERRQPVQIPDVRNAPSASVLDIVVQAGFRAILIVPLLGPERAIGVLVIRRKAPGEFPQSTLELLQTFAAQSVLAIQNARLFHEIEEKSRELELASRHKSQFLANMSHELRTPLNAILGYSELILDDIYGEVPDKARAALERVQSNGKHLLGLINDVLDLAKIEAGRLTLSLADYSMNEVVASVVSSIEAVAAEKHLALKVEMPPYLPIGHGDEQRIRQVLLNLVSNAIKFTDSGEVAIKVLAGNGAFQVAVSDTGPGISAEDQTKLFQEFQQADNSSTRNKGGTGLGLAISRRFIDLQGGRIWVESALGQGSTFAFELPVTVDVQEDVE